MKSPRQRILAAFILMMTVLMLSGCIRERGPGGMPEKAGPYKCYYGDVDYASVLRWNGIIYMENSDGDISGLKTGDKVGKIRYRKADHTCPRDPMQDGDATLLEVGTQLYEVKGYKAAARLMAGDRLYEATDNPSARTLNDLLDIEGKIKTVRFVSGMDGSPLKDFTPEASAVFIREYPKLKYVPFRQLAKETKQWVGDKYWLELELNDGSSRRMVYNAMFAAFHPSGYATPELARLVEAQRKLIYAQ
ncbi:hypothetical protein JI735_01180 [Paenibacillus sonchi]|uniref:Lipoprotein n=1 Tax=Paenibacillus sonchi TaxID=373687 RepID=A0A974SDP4_9BACL|nr:hypothetical protein [Paenibacillus sonchi]QQZ61436.1 hypothetical protein JI735_01180 [Paenibacillus sonchi]